MSAIPPHGQNSQWLRLLNQRNWRPVQQSLCERINLTQAHVARGGSVFYIWCVVMVMLHVGLRQQLYRLSRLFNGLPTHNRSRYKPSYLGIATWQFLTCFVWGDVRVLPSLEALRYLGSQPRRSLTILTSHLREHTLVLHAFEIW